MLLENIDITTLTYLERYVNNGSPSGFTSKFTTSEQTTPFSKIPFITPYICYAPKENTVNFGNFPSFSKVEKRADMEWMIVHPDMASNSFFSKNNLKLELSNLQLIPTASGRTLEVVDPSCKGYVKLHYEGIIGRINRDLSYLKAISGPEVSQIIMDSIDLGKLDFRLTIMPKTGAKVFLYHTDTGISDWGMNWRDQLPYKTSLENIQSIVPVFSLFGHDVFYPEHATILEQIIASKSIEPMPFVLNKIIVPLVECYFSLLKTTGIQPEWHAQNLLVLFDHQWDVVKFVMRDMESMDKDLSLMETLGIPHNFKSYPFKCLTKEQYNYTIKHSFMFDYKFGEYIIQPLLDFLETKFSVNTRDAILEIKKAVGIFSKGLPENFFPKNKWYVFENILIDQSSEKRPYIEYPNPKFR